MIRRLLRWLNPYAETTDAIRDATRGLRDTNRVLACVSVSLGADRAETEAALGEPLYVYRLDNGEETVTWLTWPEFEARCVPRPRLAQPA